MILTYLDDCINKFPSPYKMFNLLAVANMSEKNTSRFMGGIPLGSHGNNFHMKIFDKRRLR